MLHTQTMKKQVLVTIGWCTLSVVLAIALLLFTYCFVSEDAFNIIFGVVIGAAATAIPQVLTRQADRFRRNRVAAVLVRTDFYAHQEWIVHSLQKNRWLPVPQNIATPEHLATLPDAMSTWKEWEPVSQAWRFSTRLIGLSKTSEPAAELVSAWKSFESINRAKAALSSVDGGPSEPHRNTKFVRKETVGDSGDSIEPGE